MSGQWWESNLIVGPFSNITEANAWAAANPSSLFLGLLATSNGQQISWGGAGVGWAGAGTALPTYPTYEALNAAMPAGVRGRCASVKQISGPGDYKVYDTGTRWAVCPGEAPVCDSVEVTINSNVGMPGIYQTMGVYSIPAGLIGDGEIWEWADTSMQSAGSSPATIGVIAGASTFLSSVAFATAASAMVRGWRKFRRRGSSILRMYATNSSESNAAGVLSNFTVAADFSLTQALSYQVAPGSATDVITMYSFALRRAA